MSATSQFKGILILVLSLFLFSCGSSDKNESSSTTKAKKSNKVLPSKCDKVIEDYDKLITKVIQNTKDKIDGKKIDPAEEKRLEEEAEELGKKILKLGYAGLGGQHCYQEFIDIQMKWTNMAMEIQQEAIKKAMEKME